MRCDEVRELLGPYVDSELDAESRAVVDTHVCSCDSCQCEIRDIRALGDRIKSCGCGCGTVPPALWDRIANHVSPAPTPRARGLFLRLRPFAAAAACLLVAVGGLWLLSGGPGLISTAQAAPVDFSVLLNGLSVDAEKAFRQFVDLYKGRRVSASEARQHAPQLNFAVPEDLPGGFALHEAFALRIGDAPAAAAIYRRDSEFIGTIFHRAIHPEDYGTYRDHPCVVGEHRGHRVDVGEWRLVHVTDATTCHCVLSRLDESKELPAILRAVAPDFQAGTDHSHP